MKPKGPRLFVFDTRQQFVRTVPVLPRDEVDIDDVDTAAEDHVGGGWDSDLGRKEEDRFRSRSVRRFPCGTPGCGRGFLES